MGGWANKQKETLGIGVSKKSSEDEGSTLSELLQSSPRVNGNSAAQEYCSIFRRSSRAARKISLANRIK